MTIFRISVTVLAVIHAAFVGLTSLVGAFANGGDVWQRLLGFVKLRQDQAQLADEITISRPSFST